MLAFIDESGQPHPNDSNPVSTLVAVCMREREHRTLSRQLHAIKMTLVGREDVELKSLELMNERTFRRIPAKKELVEATFDLVSRLDVTIFAIIMPRPKSVPDIRPDHLPTEHIYLLQRVNALAEEMGEEALLIYDGRGMNIHGRNLSACINGYIFKVAEYNGILKRTVDTALFVDSRVTPGIQLSDLAASAVRQYQQNDLYKGIPAGDLYLSAIARFYNTVKRKTRDDLTNDRGKQLWGLYKFREELSYQHGMEPIEQEQVE